LFNPLHQRYLLILSMIKIFQRSYEDDKTVGHEYSVLTHAKTDYIAV